MANSKQIWHRRQNDACVTTVHSNEWFKIKKRDDYYSFEYEVPQVVILPIVENKHILMVRGKRPLINDNPLELPAGGGYQDEPPIETARRELDEETGVKIDDLSRFKKLPLLSELPNRSPELLLSYMVDLTIEEYQNRGEYDTSEVSSVELLDFKSVKNMISKGEIYLSSPIAIITRYLIQKDHI